MGVLWEYCLKNIHNYPRCIFTSLIILPKEVTQTQVLTMNRRFKTFNVEFFKTSSYENESTCREFVQFISKSIFEKTVKSKYKKTNVISILCNGSKDSAVTEKSVFMFFLLIIKHSFQLFLSFH